MGILLDAVASDQGFLRTFKFPDYITDEVWELLGDILEQQKGYHGLIEHIFIGYAVERLTDLQREVGGEYGARAKALVSRLRPNPYAPIGSE